MRSTKGNRLEDVGAAADATVDGDGNLPGGGGSADSERVEGGRDAIQLATAVVGDDDTI